MMNESKGKTVVLLTGRAGSKSVVGKNIYPVLGRPLAWYPMQAAKEAELVDEIFISTDSQELKSLAQSCDINFIERPSELAQDKSELVDAILHALEQIGKVEYLVTMHCNCGVHRQGLVDECIRLLQSDSSADSVVTGYVDHSVHPFRTRKKMPDGTLEPWMEIPEGASSNRQSLEPCFILDGAVRVMRVQSCFPPSGVAPFGYLGKRLLSLENDQVGDVHSLDDIKLTEDRLTQLGRKNYFSENQP